MRSHTPTHTHSLHSSSPFTSSFRHRHRRRRLQFWILNTILYHHNNRKTFIVRAHSPFREKEKKLNVGRSEKYVKSRLPDNVLHIIYLIFHDGLFPAWSLHYKPESYVVNKTRSAWVQSGAQLHSVRTSFFTFFPLAMHLVKAYIFFLHDENIMIQYVPFWP